MNNNLNKIFANPYNLSTFRSNSVSAKTSNSSTIEQISKIIDSIQPITIAKSFKFIIFYSLIFSSFYIAFFISKLDILAFFLVLFSFSITHGFIAYDLLLFSHPLSVFIIIIILINLFSLFILLFFIVKFSFSLKSLSEYNDKFLQFYYFLLSTSVLIPLSFLIHIPYLSFFIVIILFILSMMSLYLSINILF